MVHVGGNEGRIPRAHQRFGCWSIGGSLKIGTAALIEGAAGTAGAVAHRSVSQFRHRLAEPWPRRHGQQVCKRHARIRGWCRAIMAASISRLGPIVNKKISQAHLGNVLRDATIPELPNHYRGKVRENYDLPDGRRIIIATDRLSAFDRILTAVPLKGQVLTQTARFWFEATARHLSQSRYRLSRSRTSSSAGGSTSCRSRSSCGIIWPALPAPRSCPCTRPGEREIYGIAPARRLAREPEAAAHDHHPDHQSVRRRARRAADAGRDRRTAACYRASSGTPVSATGACPVRARPPDRGRERPDPCRHEIRIRLRRGWRHHPGRRDPHAGQQPLLVRRKL